MEGLFSVWSAPCPVLGNGPIDTHSDNRRDGFYVVHATILTRDMFSMGSNPMLCNESLFVAGGGG
jgi:hypothetical protein